MSSVQEPDIDYLLQRDCEELHYSSSSSSEGSCASMNSGDHSGMCSRVSTPTGGTPPPSALPGTAGEGVKRRAEREGGLKVPDDGRRGGDISRSPSPAGLIPIHKTFSKLVRYPTSFLPNHHLHRLKLPPVDTQT